MVDVEHLTRRVNNSYTYVVRRRLYFRSPTASTTLTFPSTLRRRRHVSASLADPRFETTRLFERALIWQDITDSMKSQSNLGRATSPPSRQRITAPQSPTGYNGDVPHLPQNCPFPFNGPALTKMLSRNSTNLKAMQNG